MSLLNNDSERVSNSASVTLPSDDEDGEEGMRWGGDAGLLVVVVVDDDDDCEVTGFTVGICGRLFHALGMFDGC